MKKNILFIALLVGVVSFSQAQQRPQRNPEEMAKRNVEILEKQLSLTPEQKTKVSAILLKQMNSMDSLRKAGGQGDREAMRAQMQNFQAENQKKIKELLTEEQKKAYEKHLAERRERMNNRQGGNAPTP